jgi:dTMP kinase
MRARYICLEGTEGVGKTTQTDNLVQYLQDKGYRVLKTKEPGTPLSPLTMELRKIMLDAQYENQMTTPARELVSQAIRSIHLEKVIKPALDCYDFIVQDRGILSGLAYGTSCGNDSDWLNELACSVNTINDNYTTLYDTVIYLTGDVSKGLETALNSKQEFEAGDAMEARGNDFLQGVSKNMEMFSKHFNTKTVNVDNKDIQQVFGEILGALNLE